MCAVRSEGIAGAEAQSAEAVASAESRMSFARRGIERGRNIAVVRMHQAGPPAAIPRRRACLNSSVGSKTDPLRPTRKGVGSR